MSGKLGRKPLLGEQINWSHPLSKGLLGCWLMNETSGGVIYDLSGNKLNLTTNMGWHGATLLGGNTLFATHVQDAKFFVPKITISMGLILRETEDDTLWGIMQDTTFDRWYFRPDNTTIWASFHAGSGLGSETINFTNLKSPGQVLDTFSSVTLVADGVNKTLYVDDTFESIAAPRVVTDYSSSPEFNIDRRYDTAFDGTHDYEYCFMYSRDLSTPEVLLLHRDPYAMFQKSPYGRIFTSAISDLSINVNDCTPIKESLS